MRELLSYSDMKARPRHAFPPLLKAPERKQDRFCQPGHITIVVVIIVIVIIITTIIIVVTSLSLSEQRELFRIFASCILIW